MFHRINFHYFESEQVNVSVSLPSEPPEKPVCILLYKYIWRIILRIQIMKIIFYTYFKNGVFAPSFAVIMSQ